jgi:hypothetical protein
VDGLSVIIVGSDGRSLNDAGNVTKDKEGPCYSCFDALCIGHKLVIRGDGYPDSGNTPKLRLNPRTCGV